MGTVLETEASSPHHKMTSLLVIVSAVFVALASAQHPPPPPPPPNPKCCAPPQWEGGVGEAGGFASGLGSRFQGESGQVYYDFENKLFAHTGRYEDSDGNFGEYKFIHNYKTKMRYFIENGKCNATESNRTMYEFCVPGDAKLSSEFFLGAGGWNTLPVKSYTRQGDGLNYATMVTARFCVPVVDTLIGEHHGFAMANTHLFADITPGIKDPSVFTPPASCKKVSHMTLHRETEYVLDILTKQ